MKGPKTAPIAHKRLPLETLKKRKADTSMKKEKSSKKNTGAPKRPPGPFLIFMEEFRKTIKQRSPANKSVSAVGKAGGEKWKSLSASEKAPYVTEASKRKAQYEKALEAFNNGNKDEANSDGLENSTSEVNDNQGEKEESS